MKSCLALAVLAGSLSLSAADRFVAPTGDDADPGTVGAPFRTIQRGADALRPGDTCFVRAGVYRESVTLRQSGEPGRPVRLAAYPGEVVVLEGTDPITTPWERYRGSVFRTRTALEFEQLFVDRRMMMEARWPNTTFARQFTRDGWATTGPNSAYQLLHDPELAETGIDWTGATAILNVAHQFWTWSRPVLNHRKGGDTFEYRIKMNPFHTEGRRWWHDDFYYLLGRLEALDVATEWFRDADGWLYLWAPDGKAPGTRQVAVKQRQYGVSGTGIKHVRVRGLHFFGCTFELTDAEHCVVEHCNLLFPSFSRGVPDSEEPRKPAYGTRVVGNDNTVRWCSLAHCGNWGIRVRGLRNTVENCLIHDVNWTGTLRYTGIALGGIREEDRSENAARFCTVYNSGNTIVNSSGNRHGTVEYCHLHHGGMICKDISLVYTSMPTAAGNEFRYNWVHDSLSPGHSLGIRGDDKTRGMHVHHNVIWNCAKDGVVAKGGRNRVYNNTCLWNGASDIYFNSGREPDKWWQKHVEAYVHQNEDSLLINNCAEEIVSTRRAIEPGLPGDNSHNYTGTDPRLMDPEHLDFRPRPDSPLVDAGRAVEGVTSPYAGKAPDVGAYELGGKHWLPGHRNGICVTRGPGGLRAALSLPVNQPVAVTIHADAARAAMVRFGPDDWMVPQPLPPAVASAGVVRFHAEAWGEALLADAKGVRPLVEVRVPFPKPDLSSTASADPKFHYRERYRSPAQERPAARAYYTDTAVVTDGAPDAAEWPGWAPERALCLRSLSSNAASAIPDAGDAYLLFDDSNLYVAVRVTAEGGDLLREGGEWGPRGTDGVEVDLRAISTRGPGPTFVLRGYPSGELESAVAAGAPTEDARRLGQAAAYAARITDAGAWTCEFRIPFAALGAELSSLQYILFNVGTRRNGADSGPWFAAVKTGGANYAVDAGAVLHLDRRVKARSRSLVVNGSFEGEGLDPWFLTSNSRDPVPDGTLSRVREGADGGWCVMLSGTDVDAMEKRVFKWLFPLKEPGGPATYCLSYDVRLESLVPRGQMGSFNSYIRTGRNVGQQQSILVSPRLPWRRRDFLLKLDVGETPSFLSLQLHRATGRAYVDNVSLIRCGE